MRRIPVLNRQRQFRIDRKAVAAFCSSLLRNLGLQDRALSVVFLGAREMRSINRDYRGKDYATDVLSFPYEGIDIEGMLFLGEILIVPEVAVNQAIRHGVAAEKELRKLILHGILHLMGYDHETDKGQMNHIQSKMMRRTFFLSAPSLAIAKITR